MKTTLANLATAHPLIALLVLAVMAVFLLPAIVPAMASAEGVRDAALKLTRALPASTAAVTTAAAIDTGTSTSLGQQNDDVEYLITAPAVTTAQLPDTKTFTYKLIQSDNSDLSSPSNVYGSDLITQTGAGAAGAAAATKRVRLPSDAKRYIGLVVTPSASGTGDASAASATLEALF